MVTGTIYNVFLYHNKAKFVWRHLKILKMHYCIYISLLFMIFFFKKFNSSGTGGFQHRIQLANIGTDRVRADSIGRVNFDDKNMSIRLRTFQQ